MKVRNGFVSNSSSSSFLIGCKGALTPDRLIGVFKVDAGSPLFNIAESFAEILCKNATKVTLKSLLNEYCYDEDDDLVREVLKKNLDIYTGYVSDEAGDSLEAAMCNIGIKYESDDFILYKEEGY